MSKKINTEYDEIIVGLNMEYNAQTIYINMWNIKYTSGGVTTEKIRYFKIWLFDGRIDYICGQNLIDAMIAFGHGDNVFSIEKWEEK